MQRALGLFTVEEITEGFAAARGLALPSQLRHLLRAQGRDLHADFVRLLPAPPQPVSIQRWSLRRVGLMGATGVLLVLLVGTVLSMTGNDAAVRTSIEVASLDCTDLEPLWLQAQAPRSSVVQYDVFPGGCLTTRIQSPAANRAEVTGSAPTILGFVPRQQLGQALEARSGGRLQLDPAGR